jgi:hypothetical protein
MKAKSLAVISVLVLGYSFAAAQTYSFGFADMDGNLYCDYEQITVSGGIVTGVDNLSGCGYTVNATLIGGAGTDPVLEQQSSLKVNAILADNIADAEAGAFTDSQVVLFQALKCNKQDKTGKYHGKPGWALVVSSEGVIAGVNSGFLSCNIPAKGDGDALMRGTSFGKLREKLRK